MFTENPIPLEVLLTKDDGSLIVDPGGVRASLTGQPGEGLGDGVFCSINWTDPDGYGFSTNYLVNSIYPGAIALPEYTGGSLAQYWENLAAIIGADPLLAPYFRVYSSANANGSYTIWAVARSTDPKWSIGWGPVSGNPNGPFFVVNDIQPETMEGYIVRCDVLIDTADGYRLVGTVGSVPNKDSRVSWDLAALIGDSMKNDLPYPAIPSWSTSAPYRADLIDDYYLRISELSERDGIEGQQYVRGLQAMLGGVANFLNARGNYLTTFSRSGIWLSWRADRRSVGIDEPVFLANVRRDFNNPSSNTPYLQVEETTADGTVITRNAFQDNRPTIERYSPIVWPVGPAQLGISEETLFYRVRPRIERGAGLLDLSLADWRTFVVDRTEYESVRYLAYLNSFYLPEVLRCTGSASKSMGVDFAETAMVRNVASDISVPDRSNYRALVRDGYTFATGYKEQRELETILQELYRSPRVYEITPTGFTPLVLRGRSFPLAATARNLHSAVIECELALDNTSYSRIDDRLIIPPPDNWQSPDGADWTSPDETPWSN